MQLEQQTFSHPPHSNAPPSYVIGPNAESSPNLDHQPIIIARNNAENHFENVVPVILESPSHNIVSNNIIKTHKNKQKKIFEAYKFQP